MKRFARIFLFLLFFQLEVSVKAKAPAYQDPSHCLAQGTQCIFSVKASVFQFLGPDYNLHLVRNSLFEKVDIQKLRYIEGVSLFQVNEKALEIETLYGLIQVNKGDFWLRSDGENKIIISNVDSDLKIKLRDGQLVSLPEGFQFWISGIATDGKSKYGVLEPVDFASLLPSLAVFHKGSKEDFYLALAKLRLNHKQAVEQGSLMYQEGVDRHLASVKAQEEAKALRQQQAAAEKRRVKELFFKRTFEK